MNLVETVICVRVKEIALNIYIISLVLPSQTLRHYPQILHRWREEVIDNQPPSHNLGNFHHKLLALHGLYHKSMPRCLREHHRQQSRKFLKVFNLFLFKFITFKIIVIYFNSISLHIAKKYDAQKKKETEESNRLYFNQCLEKNGLDRKMLKDDR